MRLYLMGLITLLLLSGCGSSPDAKLAPKLSRYTTVQQQCSNFLDGKSELTGNVEKECDQFLKRLDTANETANKLATKKLKKGEFDQTKLRYARERNKLKQQYHTLLLSVKEATKRAIKQDDIKHFSLAIAFPGNHLTSTYYTYMKSKAPQFDTNQQYLDFRRQESEKLMLKAQHYLKQGEEKKALIAFEKAAEMSNPQAAYSTGLLYEKSDPKRALSWHKVAAQSGVKAAYLNLGRLYEAQKDKEQALRWYLKASDQGSAKAQYRLYNFYQKSDEKQSLSWLEKSSSNGYTHAQYKYALVLMQDGKTDKAIALLRQASQKNYPQASDYLGEYYYNLKLYERAYAQLKQTESANAFYLRAKMLEKGMGTTQNYSLAYTFYTRANALGKKEAKQDAIRVDALSSKQQQQDALKEVEKQRKMMAAMVEQCGNIPTPAGIKKRNQKFHIVGTASAPVGRQSFVIYGNDGEDYFLLNAKGIQEDDKVNISAMSTGSTATVDSAEDEEAFDIYQFKFIKKCVIEEGQ